MQTPSCIRGLVFAAVFALGSHAGAQCLKTPAGSGPCGGKLNLTISKSGKGSLSMTHCPFPTGIDATSPVTLTIAPLGFSLQFYKLSYTGDGTPCTGIDEFRGPSGERLRYIFGAGETVIAKQLRGLPLPLSGSTVTVTISDSSTPTAYTVSGTLTCTATKSRIRCQ
jgi:hypothetical protein